MKWILALAVTALFALESGLDAVKAESNLEKRSEKALEYAADVLTLVRTDIETKPWATVEAQIQEFRAAIDLSYESLKSSGKQARRSPKYFKKADVALRTLGRRLRGIQEVTNLDDRPKLDEVIAHVDRLQDELVAMTMGEK